MQYFELLLIMFGIANGALLPLLPDPTAKERPIGAILWFSLAAMFFVALVPVVVLSPRFISTTLLSLAGAAAGFIAVKAARAELKAPVVGTATSAKPVKHHA